MDKHYADYFKGKINNTDIIELKETSYYKFVKELEGKGLRTYGQYFKSIKTGVPELDDTLKRRYTSLANRCNGHCRESYDGKDYLMIIEWVQFCKDNQSKLLTMWNSYINHDKDMSYAISIDRINNDKGYIIGNIQFVTHGYNSWKRNLDRPVKAKKGNDKWRYFMSSEEASRYYGIRRQAIGEVLNEFKYSLDGYRVEVTTVEKTLKANGYDNTKDYYKGVIRND